MKTLGFIGMGNMAGAIAAGILQKGLMKKEEVFAYAPHYEKLEANAEKIGFVPCKDLKGLTAKADTLVMACKPYQIEGVLSEIKEELKGKALISIAAGWNYDKYEKYLDKSTRLQFIMPNTPAMVGEGVLLFEEKNSKMNDLKYIQPNHYNMQTTMSGKIVGMKIVGCNLIPQYNIKKLFEALGIVIELPVHLMGIGGALTGCGPAFVDLIIEALGDAGVKYGVPRKQAYEMVSQMILGSAKLQLETGEHPGVLKDNVCSPAGTTICGVDALEHAGIRAGFIDAIDAIMNK